MNRLTGISAVLAIDPFLVDLSLRAGAVLAIAFLAERVLRGCRWSAAARHAMLGLAIAGVVALPFLAATLPRWGIALPFQAAAPAPDRSPARSPRIPAPAHRTATDVAVLPGESAVPAAAGSPSSTAAVEPVGAAVALAGGGRSTGARSSWLLAIWLIGAGLALAPAVLALASLGRLGRASRTVTEGPLVAALDHSMGRLGLKRPVRLLASVDRSMPMTWGLRRPTILVPEEAERWSTDRLAIVMLHELAHIQRRDCLSQSLSQVVRAIHWFNPLSWLAERRLRALQEEACDDVVMTCGFDPADYAEHLLAVSADFRAPAFAAGLAMARPSRIERRLVSILSPRRNRGAITRVHLAISAAVAFAILAPLSVAHFYLSNADVAPPLAAAPPPAEAASPLTASGPPAEVTPPGPVPPAPAAPSPIAAAPPAEISELRDSFEEAMGVLRNKITELNAGKVDEEEFLRGAIKGMIGALHDPYSDYLTPEMLEEAEKQLRGSLVGIGVQLEAVEARIRVVTPLEDSPAFFAGIQAGDEIDQIDDVPTAGLALSEAVKRIAGPQGTVVRLAIGRGAGNTFRVNVTRDTFRLPSVKGARRGTDHHWSFMLDGAHGVGYAQILSLGRSTPEELRAALDSLKARGLRGLILDLRSCPGGLLESATAVAGMFLDRGTIVSIQSRSGKADTLAGKDTVLVDVPMVVLVNGQTSSAAEIVAGALKDNQRAIVLGTRTFGKGSVQSIIKLDGGNGAIKLTTAYYQLPGGKDIDRRGGANSWGIDPDEGYFVPIERAQLEELSKRRRDQDIIGRAPAERAEPAEVTPQSIESEMADPQLAAALKTMVARLTGGQFVAIGEGGAADVEAFLKREEVDRRRAAIEKELEKLNRELADLKSL